MDITSFGILIYSVFTIVAGCLNDNSYEPPELVVVNGLAELVQVVLVKSFEIKLYQKLHTDMNFQSNAAQHLKFEILFSHQNHFILEILDF